MKVQVTIMQDYCPHPDMHPCDNVCSTGEFTYEADVPDSLVGPISEPVPIDEDFGRKWGDIRPVEKRDMLLEDLWLEAESKAEGR